jgi:hypothetical protein
MSVSVEAAGTGRAAGAPRRIRWFVVAISVAIGIVAGALLSQAIGLGAGGGTPAAPTVIAHVQPPVQPPSVPVDEGTGLSGTEVSGPGWSSDCRAVSRLGRC